MQTIARRAFLGLIGLLAVALVGWTALTTDAAPQWQSPQPTATATPVPGATTTATPVTGTPTPTKPPIRTEILFPQAGDVVYGTFPIQGTAVVNNYQQYQVHISPSGEDEWSWLNTSFAVVRDGNLAMLDSTLLPDGFYDLRLRAIRQDGNYTEAFVRGFEVRNQNPPTPTPLPAGGITDTVDSDVLPPLSPIGTPTPTATATPDTTSFVPGGQGIYAPGNGDVLHSYERIVGTANGKDPFHRFQRYELYISQTGQDEWDWLFSSQDQFYNDTLYVLDTTDFPNGVYDLRLRIVYRDANYDEYFVRNLRIDNDEALLDRDDPLVRITSPAEGSTIAGVTDVTGTVVHPDFQRWELYWAEHQAVDQNWIFLFEGDYQIVDDLIARLDLSQVTRGTYDLRLRVVRRDGNYDDIFIRRLHVVPPTQSGQEVTQP